MRGRTVNNSGMTLLEVVLSIGIFSIIMTAFLQILMSVHRTNNSVAASMTANAAIRSLADEALATAVENARDSNRNYAAAFIQRYRGILNNSDENYTLPIGPDGTELPRVALEHVGTDAVLVHYFPVPEPGSLSRFTTDAWSGGAAVGDVVPYKYGLGAMRIYIDENAMPGDNAVGGTLGGKDPLTVNDVPIDSGGIPVIWETGGDRPESVTDGSTSGFPGDGSPEIDDSLLTSDQPLPEGINRVFADITVTYYDDAAHTRELAVNERRILVTGSFDGAARVWPPSTAL